AVDGATSSVLVSRTAHAREPALRAHGTMAPLQLGFDECVQSKTLVPGHRPPLHQYAAEPRARRQRRRLRYVPDAELGPGRGRQRASRLDRLRGIQVLREHESAAAGPLQVPDLAGAG